MQELQIFKNESFGEVRTIITENNEVLFCAKDVASNLGYKDTNKAIKAHCKRGSGQNTPHPQNPTKTIVMIYIPESDVFRLAANSKLPQAEEFENWIYEEVLPSIRKNGGYIANQESMTDEELMAKAYQVALKVIKQKEDENNKLRSDNSKLTVDNNIMKPKAEYFDELVDRNLLTNFRETAKQLNVGEKKFIKFLIDKKFIYRDKKGKLMPYALHKNDGLFEMKECFNEKTQWSGTQTLVTPKGRETFRLLYAEV